MYLLDTNVVINFLEASLPAGAMNSLGNIIDVQCNISIVTKMEALGFNFKTVAEQNSMETFIGCAAILELTDEVVNKTIEIRKSKKINLPDAIIAATSIVSNLILITRNAADFKNIIGLQVIDPHTL
jgi:predicted nucleic acid-binding protein